ncbi:hypothetical protein CC86DRAFT_471007 [Ophiobolus disseminans]|uniref:Uncharacterized protein n=1 Tax=Ophiobolus disseminans TaxID=1469910 RepID=A0A6A6ZJ52_9PLEO|nr:hypothetical protein CC86DRAFT_471007 [Ophiobolus disseminans]
MVMLSVATLLFSIISAMKYVEKTNLPQRLSLIITKSSTMSNNHQEANRLIWENLIQMVQTTIQKELDHITPLLTDKIVEHLELSQKLLEEFPLLKASLKSVGEERPLKTAERPLKTEDYLLATEQRLLNPLETGGCRIKTKDCLQELAPIRNSRVPEEVPDQWTETSVKVYGAAVSDASISNYQEIGSSPETETYEPPDEKEQEAELDTFNSRRQSRLRSQDAVSHRMSTFSSYEEKGMDAPPVPARKRCLIGELKRSGDYYRPSVHKKPRT